MPKRTSTPECAPSASAWPASTARRARRRRGGIRADADRDARITIAKAREASELLRGVGDAESTRIYAEAYSQDPDFYHFLRSLEAYEKTLGEGTTVVLPPSHEFFRLFQTGGTDLPSPPPPPVSAPVPAPAVVPTDE